MIDYLDFVKDPISFQDIKAKLDEDEPYLASHLVEDMRLMFDNADAYNTADNFVMRQCAKLTAVFTRIFKEKFEKSNPQMEALSKHF